MDVEKRNQKLFITSGFVSLVGNSLFTTALMYYLSHAENATFYLSLITLIMTIPSVFATIIGVFTDRFSPKKVMVTVQSIQAVLCLGLIWAFKTIPVLLVFILFLEIFATINSIAEIPLVAQILPPEKRSKVIGLLHAIQNALKLGGRFFGATLLILIHPVGIAIANAISFIFASLCVSGVRLPKRTQKTEESKYENVKPITAIRKWREGWKALRQDRLTARFTLALTIIGAMFVPVEAFLSLILVDRLHVNTFEFGLAFAMEMIGGIVGGLFCSPIIKHVVSRYGYAAIFLFDFLMMGLSILVLGIATQYWVIVGTMLLLGLVQSFQNITAPTYIMYVHSGEVLGRVMGTLTSVQAGSALLASVVLTAISTAFSFTWILIIAGGIVCVSTIGLFAFPVGILKTNVQMVTKNQ
ncbi:MFS transporter [Camelliibacillus cellulosilyticus]|uniref:MFS transporter n=1 Tax=Camelliibacillus cellulosilyticus TaxID=2174486 RepID=A0ABV9GSW8_9BACL